MVFYACHFHTFNKQARRLIVNYHKRMESIQNLKPLLKKKFKYISGHL